MSSPIDKVDDSVLHESLIVGAKDGFVAAALTTIFIMATSKRIPMIGALTPQAKFATVSGIITLNDRLNNCNRNSGFTGHCCHWHGA